MLSEGFVLKIDGEFATVGVKRNTACDTCRANCGGHCDKASTVETVVKNTLNAQVGDRVRLYSRTSTVLTYALLVFIVPIIAAMLGYFIPDFLGADTVLSAIICIVAVAIYYCIIYLSFKNKKPYETIQMYDII